MTGSVLGCHEMLVHYVAPCAGMCRGAINPYSFGRTCVYVGCWDSLGICDDMEEPDPRGALVWDKDNRDLVYARCGFC